MDDNRKIVVKVNPYKSLVAAILLPVVLGPIGLLYSSFLGSIIMIFLFLFSSVLSLVGVKMGVIYALLWIVGIFWSVGSSIRYNKKINKIFMPELGKKKAEKQVVGIVRLIMQTPALEIPALEIPALEI